MRRLDALMVLALTVPAVGVGSLTGCGVVNGLGGPWPIGGTTNDGGPEVVPSDGGACPVGSHNGGADECVPAGECANGYVLEGNGRCSRWTVVGAVSPARTLHTVTALPAGGAVTVGGLAGTVPIGAGPSNLYNPDDGSWRASDSSVLVRYRHTATSLGGNRIVVAGGLADPATRQPAAELYRVDQDRWVELGELVYGRTGHQAAAFADGTFLVIGGRGPAGAALSNVEELAAGEFTVLPASMNVARTDFAAVVVGDDELFVVGGKDGGGQPLASVEHHVLGDASFTQRTDMVDTRSDHTATLLNDGRIVVVGGRTDGGGELEPLRTVEVYEPGEDRWADFAPLAVPRWGHSAALLDDGRLLIVGGFSVEDAPTASVEIIDPATGGVSEGPPLGSARGHAPTAVLADGLVLVVQGSFNAADEAAVTSVERYDYGRDLN